MKMFTNASLRLSRQQYIVQIQSEMNFTAPCKAGVSSHKEEHSSIIVLMPGMLFEAIRRRALCWLSNPISDLQLYKSCMKQRMDHIDKRMPPAHPSKNNQDEKKIIPMINSQAAKVKKARGDCHWTFMDWVSEERGRGWTLNWRLSTASYIRPESSFCIYTGTAAEKHEITMVKEVGYQDSPCLTRRYLEDLWIWIWVQLFVFWSSPLIALLWLPAAVRIQSKTITQTSTQSRATDPLDSYLLPVKDIWCFHHNMGPNQ